MVGPTPDEIKRALCELTFVEADSYGFEIVLPQIYSTGETVVVTAQPEGDKFFVHDSGLGAMALEAAGVATSPRLHEEIGKGVRAYGCEFSQFRVYKQCSLAYPSGLAACVGATAGAIALKDRQVATAKVIADTGAVPAPPPAGPPVPVEPTGEKP